MNQAVKSRQLRQIYQTQVLEYFAAMFGCHAAMPEAERRAFHEWDSTADEFGKQRRSSQWPGWEKYIGPYPVFQCDNPQVQAKRKIGNSLRWRVYGRDGFQCVTCQSRVVLSRDHVIPESRGGPTKFENLTTLCRSCNSTKGVH